MNTPRGQRTHRWRQLALQLWAALALIACAQAHARDDDLEYEIKAAYLYKFAGYVEWPQPLSADQPFRIVVLRADRMADELRELLQGRPINGHRAEVIALDELDARDAFQMLFVGRDASPALATRALRPTASSALVVSESAGALDAGSMINFVVAEQRVQFEIGQTTAERAGFKLSARLLSAAVTVDKGELP